MKTSSIRFCPAVLAITVTGCAVFGTVHPVHAQTKAKTSMPALPHKDVVDMALANPQFSIWAKAVKQSGMDSTLHLTPGKFTLFVPTNAAFAKMPPATLKKLFDHSSDGQEDLTTLVMRHAIVGRVLHAADLKPGSLKTIIGPPVTVKKAKSGSGVTVNNAHIVQADINASNGVIQAVDSVFPN